MKEISFEDSKQVRLEIMQAIDKFCREHNLRYYLAFGTLLGAVRHHGFIPWDDDMDILMPRPDLERFIESFKVTPLYRVITNQDDEGNYYGFARVVNTETEAYLGKRKIPGINVEIYPIDGAPSDDSMFERFVKKLYAYRKRETLLIRIMSGLTRRNLWPFRSLNPPMYKHFCKKYKTFGSQYSYNKSDSVIVAFGNPYKLNRLPMEWFASSIELEFEGCKFYAPIGYDAFLESVYTDYMQLPPVEKRVPAHGFTYYWNSK